MESQVHNYGPFLTRDLEAAISKPWSPGDLLALPLRQLEFHPSNRCNWRCAFCHGLKSPSIPELEIGAYEKFIDSIPNGFIRSLIVSGQYTEPMLYPNIFELINRLSRKEALVGLYTNGTFNLEPVISDLFLHPKSYVVFNLPASNTQAISEFVGIAKNAAIESLRSIMNNLTLMAAHHSRDTSTVKRVHINCEIMETPGLSEEIYELLSFLTQFDVPISVRLTCPVTPLYQLRSPAAFVHQIEAGMNTVRSVLDAARHEFDGTNLTIVEYLVHHESNPFDKCFAMFDTMVVRSDGGVAPCCYTANRAYDELLLGNITQSDFSSLLNSTSRLRLFESLDPKLACPVCSKKDYEINERSRRILCR
jgi:radical SAM protein with 4Fe4S-binding SPASM domain